MGFRVFARTWWQENPSWPNGLEPCAGEKETLHEGIQTEEQARTICQGWNRTHPAGRLSLKAEFEEE